MWPCAKSEGLIVEDVAGETLVYDRSCDKAHRLNPTAAVVWRNCDGRTSPAEIAGRLRVALDARADEEFVNLALTRLAEANLLEEYAAPANHLSRRQLAGRLGLGGALSLLLPVVTTINAPTAAQVGSPPQNGGCVPLGGNCQAGGPPCCQPSEGVAQCLQGTCQNIPV